MVRLKGAVERRSRGYYWVRRFYHRGQWAIADMERLDSRSRRRAVDQRQPVPRSVAGHRALDERRRVRAEAEAIWQLVDPEIIADNLDHPYLLERQRSTTIPGGGLQRYLISDPQFRRPATVAQQASFEQIWSIHNAMVTANMRTFLEDCQHLDGPAGQSLQQLLERLTPRRPEANRSVSARSQLARILALINAR
jgi:hypothetical protein